MKGVIFYLILIGSFISSFTYNYDLQHSFVYLGRYLKDPVEGCVFKAIGLENLYGDLLYIRLLQYYGKKEFNYEEYTAGKYPQMYDKSLSIAITAPAYENAITLASSILAFGVGRTWEAKSVIRTAMMQNIPQHLKLRYALLLSAVVTYETNKKKVIDDKTLSLLYQIVIEKDVSEMFANIVAFLCEKAGKIDAAINIYKKISQTSSDEYYKKKAIKKLKEFKDLDYDNLKVS